MRIESSCAALQRKRTPDRRRKKRPESGDIRVIAEAWAAARKDKLYHQVAGYVVRLAGHLKPKDLNAEMILSICAEWRKRLAPNTIYTYTCQLRSLLRTLASCGAPAIPVAKVRGPRPRETVATPQDIERLLAACAPMPWMRLFILLCWQTALRFSEAIAVTPRSYDRQSNTAAIRTKGGKIRVIPMTEDIADLLRATLEGDPDRSCIHILKGSACSPQAIRSQWYRITSALQLTHINPHDLRRTTATNLYAVTNDIRAVQQYLGHDRMSSTLSYLAPLGDKQLREMHEKLRFFGKKTGPEGPVN